MITKEESFERLRFAEEETVAHQLLSGGLGAAELATNAHGFAEEMTVKLRGGHEEETDCSRGCSWCCFQSVAVYAPEVFRITEFIGQQPIDVQEKLATRLEALDQVTRGMAADQRHKIPKSCAFLEEGRCSIYEVRPLACAEFTSRDELACKRGKRVGFRPLAIIHEKARMHAFHAVHAGLADGVRKALPLADGRPLELVAAVRDAIQEKISESEWRTGVKSFGHSVAR